MEMLLNVGRISEKTSIGEEPFERVRREQHEVSAFENEESSSRRNDDDEYGENKVAAVFKLAALFMRLEDLFSVCCVSRSWNFALTEGGGISAHMWVRILSFS